MTETITKPEIPEVVCLVFEKDDQLLLEERLDEGAFNGTWMFTGGKIDPEDRENGDAVHNASVREAQEEVGLTPTETELLCTFDRELRDGRLFRFHGVLIKHYLGEVQNLEHDRRNLAWKSIDESRELLTGHEVDERILADFINRAQQNQPYRPAELI